MQFYKLDDDGKAWAYQVIALQSIARVQLWFRAPWDDRFDLGHGKNIPEWMTAQEASDIMRRYITGDIDHPEYNRLLPGA